MCFRSFYSLLIGYIYIHVGQLFGQQWLYVELYLKDSKFVLLHKLHIDYSKIFPRFICVLLSLEKIY